MIRRYSAGMDKPSVFSHSRFLGDKRTQQVYDLEEVKDEQAMTDILDELLSEETFLCFSFFTPFQWVRILASLFGIANTIHFNNQ